MGADASLYRGSASWVTGEFGQASAGGPYAISGRLFPLAGQPGATVGTYTIEAWIKVSSSGTTRVALGAGGIAWLGIQTNGYVTASGPAGMTQITGTTNIANGAWHHVALVFNAGKPSLFCDGAQIGATGSSAATVNAAAIDQLFIGGFGGSAAASSATDWSAGSGVVDEVRLSNIARYTGAYTVPTAAFTADANTIGLYHLDGDATDAVTGAAPPGQVTALTATPGSGQVALSWTASAFTGGSAITDYVVQDELSGGSWAVFNDGTSTATTATVTGLTNGSGYVFRVAAVNAAGTGTMSLSASATPVAAPTIIATDTNITYSPFNWDVTSSRALTNCAGAYFRVLIGGSPTAINLTFDVSSLTSTYPTKIKYRVDREAWTTVALAASIALTMPTDTTNWTQHLVEVMVMTTTDSVDRWDSPYATAAKFTGVSTTPTNCATVATQKAALTGIVLGDSITEGINVFGNTGDTTARSDATLSYAFLLRDILGAEVGVVGFGRQGLAIGGNGSVPVLGSTWKLNAAGLTRSFAATPDFAVVNIGTNDSTNSITAAAFQTALTALLNDMAATLAASTKILVLLPFGGYYGSAAYQAAIAATTTPSRFTFVGTAGWFTTSDSIDGVHPYGYTHAASLAPRAAAAVRAALGIGKLWINKGGAAKRIDTVRI